MLAVSEIGKGVVGCDSLQSGRGENARQALVAVGSNRSDERMKEHE